MNTTTIRALVLAVLSLVGLFFPGLIPEDVRETIADHATAVISGILGLWAIVAGLRARAQRQGREP